jgi:hypothetical protein
MNKKTKMTLAVIGVGAVAYYIYTKMKPATTKNYSGKVGDRMGADGILTRFKKAWKSNKYLPQYGVEATSVRFDAKKGFADGGYVNKGDMYNNNLRFGTGWIGNKKSMTGAPTFFTNQSEKLNY